MPFTVCEIKEPYVERFYSGLVHLVGQIHNFYSRFDDVLAISDNEKVPRKALASVKGFLDKLTFGMIDFLERNPDEKWEQRLRATQQPIIAPPNMKSHNYQREKLDIAIMLIVKRLQRKLQAFCIHSWSRIH